MKLLVIGIDALMPQLVFENPDLCPNITKIFKNGSGGAYSGYIYGYGSRDNWITMYTGLTPKEHGIIANKVKNTGKYPKTTDYSNEETLWNILSNHGVKVGFWKGLSTTPPESVNGYIISGEPHYERDDLDYEIVSRKPIVINEKRYLLNYIEGVEPKHPEPRTLEDFGYTFEEVKKDPSIIDEILKDDYFEECLCFLQENLDFRLKNIKSVNSKEPVDLLWVYEAVFDYLAHFQVFDPKRKILRKALRILDEYVGGLLEVLKPENVLVLSDHGQKSYREIFPNASVSLIEECFGLANQSIITDKHIVLIGRIGGLVTGHHSLKGIIAFAGKDFKKSINNEMRTVDLYPNLLELFNCEIPKNRQGFVHEIFSANHMYTNPNRILPKKEKEQIVLIQTEEVSEFNRIINDFYNKNRFVDIFVYGEEKYREIFLANDQVEGYYSFERDKEIVGKKKCFTAYHNRKTGDIEFFEISLK